MQKSQELFKFRKRVLMTDKPHKKLEAGKYGFEFVTEIYRVTQAFPPEEKFGLVSQLRRASVSIATNIAEGAGRKSAKEFIRFLSIALGSLSEIDTLLMLSKTLGFISDPTCSDLLTKLDTIGKLIYGLMKKLGYKPTPNR